MKIKVGDKIKIVYMRDEPSYSDKVGTVTEIDDAGQLHGTWGGLAVIPDYDEYEFYEREIKKGDDK